MLAVKEYTNARDMLRDYAILRRKTFKAPQLVPLPQTTEPARPVLTREALDDAAFGPVVRCPHSGGCTIDRIVSVVSRFYDVSIADLKSARRTKHVTFPRQVGMHLSRELTTRSLPEIGRGFGAKHHTSVMYAARKIADQRKVDPALQSDIDKLMGML